MSENRSAFAASDTPPPGTFEAIYAALEASSLALIGPARPRLLVIPIRDDNGAVVGGFWGYTLFEGLHVQMLFVPEPLRGLGIGAALMASAEVEARRRGCRGASAALLGGVWRVHRRPCRQAPAARAGR